MVRRGENISKRKDGRWEARLIVGRKPNGKAIYRSIYARSYRDVKEKRLKLLQQLERLKLEEQKAGTVETIAKDWIKYNESRWKESTKCRYLEKLNIYILPEFGNRDISNISTKEIEDFIVMLQSTGYKGKPPLGSSAASMVLTILKQLQLQVKKHNGLTCYSVECITVKKTTSTHEFLSENEQKVLVSQLEKNADEISIGILTSLFTGIRLGEICAMKCDNIDLDSGIIHVRETMQRIPVFSEYGAKTKILIDIPKSDRSFRDIPINPILNKLLQPFIKQGAFLLTGDKKRFIEPRTMENHFAAVLRQCGIRHMGYHATRRTFATRCIERGMNPRTLAEILGHADVSTTLNYYVCADMKKKAEGVQLLSDLFDV